MSATQQSIPVSELLDQAPVAVTALDNRGTIVFFNQYAGNIVDRKPEYLGRDIREFHQPASNAKVDAILDAYAQGGREEYSWRLKRGDKEFMVRVRPWLRDGKWAGLVHTVMQLG
ncbi:MAG: PAS domain-containing protein [Desulfarculaceae bacterium]|nr:PAS domain-containing protein [Desulfarculaceae bacterium]MCF8049109.1 PAS domain-containing protein [Desulfarculaceae bacterium]MCF8063938.1 PAS domain-containing protein [Desulfarculaceae bacterium]MCF8099447.1 PAS domain-containing protein [Desulfarculaceae bacterium]MCF8122898.1 PAS domain-containing protein [Desulfarculaceae bacterium]